MRSNLKKARQDAGLTQKQKKQIKERFINLCIENGYIFRRDMDIIVCPACEAVSNKEEGNFCWKCGERLKK